MQASMLKPVGKEKVTWFSMWFLASVASFGIAFFPMFYRLVDSRNKHFRREEQLEEQISEFLRKKGKTAPQMMRQGQMNAKAWSISLVLIVPVFVLLYKLSKDLDWHERHQDQFLAEAFPQRMFMPQSLPIKKYALITIVTLGFGGIYWLYKIVNLYNAHFQAQWKIETEITRLMEDTQISSPCNKKRFVSHGGDVWGFSRKYNIPLEKVLDFSGPINYLGASPKAVEAIQEYAKLVRFYPDPNPQELREAIAQYVDKGFCADNIILGNGSIELIYMITELFDPGFKGVIPVPSFTEYEKAVLRVGGDVVFVQLPSNFAIEMEQIKKAVTDDTKIIYICNPHSPSGTLYTRETILELAAYCKPKDIIVCIDENYIEFAPAGQDATVAGDIKEYPNLFVIRSVTKFYGMPGIRFGYAIASEDLIEKLQLVRQPWSINALAGFATLAAFKDQEFIQKTKQTVATERAKLVKALFEIGGLHIYPSEANFVLVKITSPKYTSTQLREELAQQGLLIRDCSTFVGLDNKYFRLTVRSGADNEKLITALTQKMKP